MTTVTIPKTLAQKGDLVLIPRREYEELQRGRAKTKRKPTELDRDLDKAIKEYREGKFYGPFTNILDLMRHLKSEKSRQILKDSVSTF
mgnify:CR=1 FL=1